MPGPGRYGNKKPQMRDQVSFKKGALKVIRDRMAKHKKAKLAG
jgi:hypothetical protein